jgi:hypothetical protein
MERVSSKNNDLPNKNGGEGDGKKHQGDQNSSHELSKKLLSEKSQESQDKEATAAVSLPDTAADPYGAFKALREHDVLTEGQAEQLCEKFKSLDSSGQSKIQGTQEVNPSDNFYEFHVDEEILFLVKGVLEESEDFLRKGSEGYVALSSEVKDFHELLQGYREMGERISNQMNTKNGMTKGGRKLNLWLNTMRNLKK